LELESTFTVSQEYRASLFLLARNKDRQRLQNLLDQGIVQEIHDTLRDQIGELLETRFPARSWAPLELSHAVDAFLDDRGPASVGTWAWFPWSRRLVLLLDEQEFVELRTSRNRYKITPDEQAALAHRRVGIVGLSVGQSVALTIALERCAGTLRLADFDALGLSNLNRLRASVHEIGVPKVLITARQIAEIDPYLRVECFGEGITMDTLDDFFDKAGRLDLLIDECDDLEMKFAMRRAARSRGVPVLMDTSDRGLLDIERFDREPQRPLFHGRVDETPGDRLHALTQAERVPLVADIIGRESLSARATASLFEVGHSIPTWPQLASSVALGGGVACDAARRILLGDLLDSGRFHVDLDEIVRDGEGAHREPVVRKTTASLAQQDGVRLPERPVHMEEIVAAAVTAPSGGNCQPWRFLAEGSRLWVLVDRARAASFLDFESTAAMAALGAATENAVLAAHAGGRRPALRLFPEALREPDALACLDFDGPSTETSNFDSLYEAVAQRCTNRRLAERRPLSQEVQSRLLDAAASIPGARLQLVTAPDEMEALGEILGAGDRVRFLEQRLHREMMSELRWDPEEALTSRDGIDLETLELSAADRVGVQMCRSWTAMQALQRFGGGVALTRGTRKAVAAASALGLVTVSGTDAADFFRGGRAMQRVWLTATSHRLAVQPLASLPYLFARLVRGNGQELSSSVRKELTTLRGAYARRLEVSPDVGEVLLMRFAHAPDVAVRSLRRSVDDVLTRAPAPASPEVRRTPTRPQAEDRL